MQQITVKELLKMCCEATAQGLGDRKIVISDDVEGNGYHGMYFGFTEIEEEQRDYYRIYESEEDINKIIVLG